MKKSILTLFALLILIFLIINCENGETNIENSTPDITELISDVDSIIVRKFVTLSCIASDADGDNLTYTWIYSYGSIAGSGFEVIWTAPETEGLYTISCIVEDENGSQDTDSLNIWVEDPYLADNRAIGMWAGNIVGNEENGPVNVIILDNDVFMSTPNLGLTSNYSISGNAIQINPFDIHDSVEFSWYDYEDNTFPSYSEYIPFDEDISIMAIDYLEEDDMLIIKYSESSGTLTEIMLRRNLLYYTPPQDLWSFWADWHGSPVGEMETISTTSNGNGNYIIQTSRDSCSFTGNLILINEENTLYQVSLNYAECLNFNSGQGYAWTKGFNWQQILVLFIVTDDDRIIFESFSPLS